MSVFGLTAIILPLLSLVLPSGRTANGWQSGVFFLGFMTLFSVNLCVACAPSKREEAEKAAKEMRNADIGKQALEIIGGIALAGVCPPEAQERAMQIQQGRCA